MTAPLIPFLNDHELETILKAAADAGAVSAGYVFLRLPSQVKDIFIEWIHHHFPLRAKRVLDCIYASRGGKAYESRFGERMRGTGEFAKLFAKRFKLALRKNNFYKLSKLSAEHFIPPVVSRYNKQEGQPLLF